MKNLIEKSKQLALKSTHRYKHGAVIFKQGKILSTGFNKTERGFSGFPDYWQGSLHAEIAAIINARTDVRGCSIMVVRHNAGNSKPCNACLAAIKAAGIKKLFYTQEGNLVKGKI